MASTVDEVFEAMKAALETKGSEIVNKTKGVIAYKIGANHEYTADLKNGKGRIEKGLRKDADLTITLSEDDFLALSNGKLNPQQAFMRGKLKLKGNMGIAMKLQTVIESARKEFMGGGSKQKTNANTTSSSGSNDPLKNLKSKVVFDLIRDALQKDGKQYVQKVNGAIRFELKNPEGTVYLDLKNANGEVRPGDTSSKADVTITINDEDMLSLATGKLNPQSAFMRGKLKLKGNMGLAMKLQTILAAAKPETKL